MTFQMKPSKKATVIFLVCHQSDESFFAFFIFGGGKYKSTPLCLLTDV